MSPPSSAVIGAGAWGTALARLLALKGSRVVLWARDPARAAALSSERENRRLLPGVRIPDGIEVTARPEAVEADVWIIAVPSHGLRETAARFRGLKLPRLVISAVKGLELASGLRPTQVLDEVLGAGDARLCALSGPSHAEEVGRDLPTAVVLASRRGAAAEEGQALLFSRTFRVYTAGDLPGVEYAGAMKNVIAIACGIGEGLELGDNARAALVTRGLAEMSRLAVALGGDRETLWGLAGLGDVTVTCTSRHSRNRAIGVRLGRGETPAAVKAGTDQVAEGIRAAAALVAIARDRNVDMPITEQVNAVLDGAIPPSEALKALLSRDARAETDGGGRGNRGRTAED